MSSGITVIDGTANREILQERLSAQSSADAIFFNLDKAEEARGMGKFAGLDKALEYLDDPRPMVLYTWMDPADIELVTHPIYLGLMGRGNTVVKKLSATISDFLEAAYQASKKQGSYPVLKALARIPEFHSLQRILEHDIKHALGNPEKMQVLLDRARHGGFVGDDQRITEAITQGALPTDWQPLAGQRFTGAFCDIQGTLEHSSGSINSGVLNTLENLAQKMPVTIWTGGNPQAARKRLLPIISQCNTPFLTTVASKDAFCGAIIDGVVIDDCSLADTVTGYGMEFAPSVIYAHPKTLKSPPYWPAGLD